MGGLRGERPARRRAADFFAEDQRRINLGYRRPCPRCHARPGGMCMDPDGRVWYQLHPERIALATGAEDQH